MDRNTRLLIVLTISLVMAAGATFFVYRTIAQMPTKEVEVARTYTVVAAKPLTLGAKIAEADVKLVGWPSDSPIPGSFTAIDQVVNRGVIAPIGENEPLSVRNVAALEAGVGLPPSIPPGMRAISVRVNEVIGVAGFVVPGTHVDVMVILGQTGNSVARVVVSNVQVLTAGTRLDQEETGKAIPSSVVTLLVSPADAEKIGLASSQGSILLTLRNPLDVEPTSSPGTRTSNLAGDVARPDPETRSAPAPRPRPQVAEAPAPPPPPPRRQTVEVIRAAKRSEETIKQ